SAACRKSWLTEAWLHTRPTRTPRIMSFLSVKSCSIPSLIGFLVIRSSTQNRTTVNVQNLTVDVTRPFSAEKDNGPRYVFWCCHPANGNPFLHGLAIPGYREDISAHIRINPARRHRIHIDAKWPKLGCQRFCE